MHDMHCPFFGCRSSQARIPDPSSRPELETTSMQRTRSSIAYYGRLWLVIGVLALAYLKLAYLNHNNNSFVRLDSVIRSERNYSSVRSDEVIQSELEACTYEQLYSSYQGTAHVNRMNQSHHLHQCHLQHNATEWQEESCWKLEDEILRIPPSAIVNRDRLNILGRGYGGTVLHGIVQLKDRSNCSVAIKTKMRKSSDGRGEYTGALPFYALRHTAKCSSSEQRRQQQQQNVLKGLTPAWAVIQTNRSQTRVRAVILPLRKFIPLDDPNLRNYTNVESAAAVAQLMLSSAKALEFVHGMGLAHQDLLRKNIGVATDETTGSSYTLLFDNTFMAVQKNASCLFKDGFEQEACRYCRDEKGLNTYVYTHKYATHYAEDRTPIEADVEWYGRAVRRTLKMYVTDDNGSAADLKQNIRECQTMTQVVETLQHFAST